MDKTRTIFYIVGSIVLVLAAVIGLTLYYTLPPRDGYDREDVVVNCMPEGAESEARCKDKGCEWKKSADGAPMCTFKEGMGYRLDGDGPISTDLGYRFNLKRIDHPGFIEGSADLDEIVVDVEMHYDYRLRIKIYDADELRYQVPEEAINITKPDSPPSNDTRMYDVLWTNDGQFGLMVERRDTGAIVFDTTVPGMTISEQFLQITTRLPSEHVYGFGEHNHKRFKHDMEWRKWSIFTRDCAPVDAWNLYGAQPFYMNLEEDGNATGVFLLNSNAMEVILQPEPYPAISYQVIGGIFDFYIFLGPTPENIVQQYTKAVGRPVMVPYWGLGYQLSRWDYDNITHVRHIVDRNRAAGIPQDVQYGDIDYMNSNHGFTFDPVKYDGLPEFVDELHSRGQRYIIMLDNFIGANKTIFDMKFNGSYKPYQEGIDQGVFIMDPRNKSQPLLGEVWPGLSVYPDFTLGETVKDWWKDQCEDFYYNWGVEFDALWIDMNEPSNFQQGSTTGCEKNDYNFPPYVPSILGAEDNGGMMYDKTICMDADQNWGKHYDVHSLYGHSHAMVTYTTLRDLFPAKRPLVLTRSNFAGTNYYATHWLGDNQSLWEHLAWSIVGMMEYSLFGFSYTGADICGFWYSATEEMCQRWHQLGAFYPFPRNHNAETWPDQDPAAFSQEMQRVTRDILMTRYKLLPFLYTLMHEAHAYGNTVVRPLVHEFPTDHNARSVDMQFLWGPAFMISPALYQGQKWVNMYVPPGRWYDYYGGMEVQNTPGMKNLSTPLDKINLHVRGGHIMPWQEPANTTVFSRQNPMGIIVALGDAPHFEAHGTLFWDDGDSFETFENDLYLLLNFTCADDTLHITVAHAGYSDTLVFNTVNIFGLERKIGKVEVNGVAIETGNIDYDSNTKSATLNNLGLDINQNHTLSWHYEF